MGEGKVAQCQRILFVQFEDVQEFLLGLAELGLDEGRLARFEIVRGTFWKGGHLCLKRVDGLIPCVRLGEQFLFLVGVGDFLGLENL